MSILDVITRASREPPFAPPDCPFPDLHEVCKVLRPVPWDRSRLEHQLGVEIPPDLAALWDACGGLVLYEDNKFRQGGLVVLSAADVVAENVEYRKCRDDDAIQADLVFAKFWGDLELAMIRSDNAVGDYGSIVIVAEMDPRSEWHTAARNLEEFLMSFMDARGEKYWGYHCKRKLAKRAKEQGR